MRPQDRARGALYGLAIGDALGMPTQMLSRRQIVDRWGPLLTGFEAAPDDHPIAAGMPAGAVTDDTEQAVLLGRLLVARRRPGRPGELATALLGWERDMAARGSLDLLGPSTKRALQAVQDGTPPAEAGRYGDTNGAAMRITPVGIATAAGTGSGPGRPGAAGEPGHPQHLGRAGGRRRRRRRGQRGHRRRRRRGRDRHGHRRRPARRASAATGRPGADVAARIDWAANLVAGRRAAAGGRGHLHPGRHQPGHPGVRAGRVRRAQRGAGRPLAGVPAGRVAGRRLRHDRRHGGRDRRRLPRPGRVPAARDRDRGRNGLDLAALADSLLQLRKS